MIWHRGHGDLIAPEYTDTLESTMSIPNFPHEFLDVLDPAEGEVVCCAFV